jgi:hypothetical protein
VHAARHSASNPRRRADDVTRTASFRTAALLTLALFLSSWTGKALGIQPCAHHEGIGGTHGPASTAAGAGSAHAHGGHAPGAAPGKAYVAGSHETHGHAAPAAADLPHEGAGHPQHGDCSCVGSCPATGVAGLPHLADGAPRAVAEALPRYASGAGELPARLLPYVLPYATAPPHAG